MYNYIFITIALSFFTLFAWGLKVIRTKKPNGVRGWAIIKGQ
jgi:hypothetical protein